MTQDTGAVAAATPTAAALPSVLDVDLAGRVLGQSGTRPHQLIQVGRKGTTRTLTALETSCTGRYIPGHRTVVVEHDWGPATSPQLSLLNMVATQLPSGLDGFHLLAHGAGITHRLLAVHHHGLLYLSDDVRRGQLDLWYRDWFATPRRLGVDVGENVRGSASTDGKTVATFNPRGEVTVYRAGTVTRVPVPFPALITGVRPTGSRVHITYLDDANRVGAWWYDVGAGVRDSRAPFGAFVPGAVSPDGAHAIVADGAEVRLVSTDDDTLLAWPGTIGAGAQAVWSPSGEYCAIDTGTGAVKLRLADGALTNLW